MINYILTCLFVLLSVAISVAQTQVGNNINGEATNDWSGSSISMPDAHTIAIGAINNSENEPWAGHTRIFNWNGSNWIQKGSDIDGQALGDFSGYSVNMCNSNTLAIGAIHNNGNGVASGNVRVFNWNGNAWIQKGSDINGEAAEDQSGISVSMPDVNTVAIGADRNGGNGTWAGHVRIFKWNGNEWIQKGLDIEGEAAGDNSGIVSMPDQNNIAIGAYRNDGNGTDAGHVRVFHWNNTSWVQKGQDIDGEAGGDFFGSALSMPDSNTVAIGAPDNDENGTDAGQVRIFQWNGNTWTQKGQDINGIAAGDKFGISLSMTDSHTISIGAFSNDANGINAGQVQVYTWDGNMWTQKGLSINGNAASDHSGFSVSMGNPNTIAIGAPYNDDNGTDAGQVRVYNFCPLITEVDVQTSCAPFIWIDGNSYSESTNNASFTLTNSQGCDSTVLLNLTINNVDTSLLVNGPTITATATAATFQWLNCDNGYSSIIGATDSIFTATQNGEYAVEITDSNCVDTSRCVTINSVGISAFSSSFEPIIYPNPTLSNVIIDFKQTISEGSIAILDAYGKQVIALKFQESSIVEMNTNELASGIYFIQINTGDAGTRTYSLMKQ